MSDSTWLEREILEQPRSLARALDAYVGPARSGVPSLERLRALLPTELTATRTSQGPSAVRVRLLGCGSAGHAAEIGARMLEATASVPARAELASAFVPDAPDRCAPLAGGEVVLALSQSGESSDTLRALRRARTRAKTCLAITSDPTSTLAREANACVDTCAGPERAIPSTKGFSGQLLALHLIALAATEPASKPHEDAGVGAALADLARLADWVEVATEVARSLDEAARRLAGVHHALFLGDGLEAALAREGALKLSETARIPSLACPIAEVRHGPMALAGDDALVVLLACAPLDPSATERIAAELDRTGAQLVVVCDAGSSLALPARARVARVPAVPSPLHAIVGAIPLQWLALRAGLARGLDVDRPRNLAKAVQVE